MERRTRIAIVATHPIQHFCPQYRSLSRHPAADLQVLFWSLRGLTAYEDREFDRVVSWDPEMLSGVDYLHAEGSAEVLDRQLDAFDPAWVILYGYRTAAARTARKWAQRNRRRIAYISDTEERHQEPWHRRHGRRARMRAVFPSVDRFLTVGDANEAFYRACGVPDSRMVRMHFPIDPAMFEPPLDPGDLRKALKVDRQALVVLTVGKLIPRKRQADLIEATRHFTKEELHLVVVGSGPDLERLERLSAGRDNVTFSGFIPPRELPAFYSAADVYAHVSDMDPHPLAVSEAAAGSCALVVSAAVGSWGKSDDVRPGETGHVVPTGNTHELERVLRRFVTDRSATVEMGARARSNAEEQQTLAHGGFLEALLETTKG